MTEDEAKTKWCPMVRYRSDRFPNHGINRWSDVGDNQKTPDMAMCIASGCAMWQWFAVTVAGPGKSEFSGYCGLAGKQS